MENNAKKFKLKIPVYTTEVYKHENEIMPITYNDLMEVVKSKIANFHPLVVNNRNKTKQTVISEIESFDKQIGNIPAVLVRVSAFDTNMYDGFFMNDAEDKFEIQKDCKVGSETNYFLLYPMIQGYMHPDYKAYFLILVYEDPTKDSENINKIVRTLAKKVLGIPIQNVKLPYILEEIKEFSAIPELQIKYYGVSDEDDGLSLSYIQYVQQTKIRKKKEEILKNIPPSVVESILDDFEAKNCYETRDINIVIGKKEYRIKSEQLDVLEGLDKMNRTAETVFNAFTEVTQDEIDNKIHDHSFMMEKISAVLINYLAGE